MTTFELVESLERSGRKVRREAGGWKAQCPAHPDGTPSLRIDSARNGGVAIHCHAGCEPEAVLAALGLSLRDLMPVTSIRAASPAAPLSVASARETRSATELARIWESFRADEPDRALETYLVGRRLWRDALLDAGYLRINAGATCDRWTNERAREGFVGAFAVRRPDASLASIVLRHAGRGTEEFGKAPTLPRTSTRSAAICKPGIRQLLEGNSEFQRDELVLCEGPTDFLRLTDECDRRYADGLDRPAWVLGCIGAGAAVSVVQTFAFIICGRTLHVALDADATGEENARKAIAAAHEAGARRVTRRVRADGSKDFAA